MIHPNAAATRIPSRSCVAGLLLVILSTSLLPAADDNAAQSDQVRKIPDVPYAEVEGHTLHLDLYLPEEMHDRPLVMFIHGGGWRAGSRKRCLVSWLADAGYPLTSIDYRLSDKGKFPAQIHDCKAAVRWLRGNAKKYGYNAERIVAIGTSAGGHLAALLGVSGGVAELEGTVGDHPDQSSRVQAVVDYYGPTDFLLRSKTQPSKTDQPDGPVYLLLGGGVKQKQELAQLASSVTHVSKDDPPLLIVHGLLDQKVNVQQSIRLYQTYRRANLPVEIDLLEGAGHGGKEFFAPERRKIVLDFLERTLKSRK